jgi:hypothetical protein
MLANDVSIGKLIKKNLILVPSSNQKKSFSLGLYGNIF